MAEVTWLKPGVNESRDFCVLMLFLQGGYEYWLDGNVPLVFRDRKSKRGEKVLQ